MYHLREDRLEAMVVNAGRLKPVQGRKTDVKDAEWIAQLLQQGLLAPGFIPPPPIRQLRDRTRQRTPLVGDRATVANRLPKVLEDAHIKLGGVASDVRGASGRARLRRLIAGEDDPVALAERARPRLRAKIPERRRAWHGRVTDHHRFRLRMLPEQVEQRARWIAQLDERIAARMAPFAAEARRMTAVPGVGTRTAEGIVAAIGTDMTTFPSAGHLVSWAGLCPGNRRRAGRQRSGRTTEGSQWRRTTLVPAAWAASHTQETVFGAVDRRWAKRLGQTKALVAVARHLLEVIYHLLKRGMGYREHAPAAQAA